MPASRSLLDRTLKLLTPRPVPAFAPPPQELAPNLWVLDRQLQFPGGARLPSRTTIVRVRDNRLIVVSPPSLAEGAAAAIDAIGVVEQVLVPNTFHYVYAEEFMARYPDASLLVAPGVPDRVPDLPRAEELGQAPPPSWAGELDFRVLGPVHGISEVVLFHLPTGSLIITDLAFNMATPARSLDRIVGRFAGFPDEFGPGRTSRRLLLRDHAAASRCLNAVSEWPIRRIVVAHGEPVEHDAKALFLRTFAAYLTTPRAT